MSSVVDSGEDEMRCAALRLERGTSTDGVGFLFIHRDYLPLWVFYTDEEEREKKNEVNFASLKNVARSKYPIIIIHLNYQHKYPPTIKNTRAVSSSRQRRRPTLLKRQIRNRITRVSHIHLRPRLIVVGQLRHIHRDLIVRFAAKVHADVIHGDVDIVHAGVIRRPGGTAVVLRQPEAHDAFRARVRPVPDADRGVGGVDRRARVVRNWEAVVPRNCEAGAVIEEEGTIDGGGGD